MNKGNEGLIEKLHVTVCRYVNEISCSLSLQELVGQVFFIILIFYILNTDSVSNFIINKQNYYLPIYKKRLRKTLNLNSSALPEINELEDNLNTLLEKIKKTGIEYGLQRKEKS